MRHPCFAIVGRHAVILHALSDAMLASRSFNCTASKVHGLYNRTTWGQRSTGIKTIDPPACPLHVCLRPLPPVAHRTFQSRVLNTAGLKWAQLELKQTCLACVLQIAHLISVTDTGPARRVQCLVSGSVQPLTLFLLIVIMTRLHRTWPENYHGCLPDCRRDYHCDGAGCGATCRVPRYSVILVKTSCSWM